MSYFNTRPLESPLGALKETPLKALNSPVPPEPLPHSLVIGFYNTYVPFEASNGELNFFHEAAPRHLGLGIYPQGPEPTGGIRILKNFTEYINWLEGGDCSFLYDDQTSSLSNIKYSIQSDHSFNLSAPLWPPVAGDGEDTGPIAALFAFLKNDSPNFTIIPFAAVPNGSVTFNLDMLSKTWPDYLDSRDPGIVSVTGSIYLITATGDLKITDFDWSTGFSVLTGLRTGSVTIDSPGIKPNQIKVVFGNVGYGAYTYDSRNFGSYLSIDW